MSSQATVLKRIYTVEKTFGNERGFSCVFRQHKARGHCRFLHGYSLGFRFYFRCTDEELTREGWVVDFGEFEKVEKMLRRRFDHTLIVAEGDPRRPDLLLLQSLTHEFDVANVITLPRTGCEAFAKIVYQQVKELKGIGERLYKVDCFEHGANLASYSEEWEWGEDNE